MSAMDAPELLQREWMDELEVSAYLKVPVETLRDWRRKDSVRVLPFHKLGRLVRYERAEVDAAMDTNRVEPERS